MRQKAENPQNEPLVQFSTMNFKQRGQFMPKPCWKNYPTPIIAPPPLIRLWALIVGEADNWAQRRIRWRCCALSQIRRIQWITLKIRQNLNTGRTVLVLISTETSGYCLSPSIYDQGPIFAVFGSIFAAETRQCVRIMRVNFKWP